jgi:hypothetical protein
MKIEKDGITTHYDKNGNEIGKTGSVAIEEIVTYKSWIEGNKWDIESIENEIRKVCYTNDIEIIDLHSDKNGWFRKTCYFNLRGEKSKLLMIQKSLKSLE